MPKGTKTASAAASKKSATKADFRAKLLKTASDARSLRTKKTPEDFAAARNAAFDAIVNGDKNDDNSRDEYELNRKPMLELMETSAAEGYTSAILYRWRFCRRPSDRTWTFNNVRLRDLLFRKPSDDASFKDNETLLEKLQNHINREYGEGFKIIFKQFGGNLVKDSKSGTEERPRRINQKFQLSIMWGEPREKDEADEDSDATADEEEEES